MRKKTFYSKLLFCTCVLILSVTLVAFLGCKKSEKTPRSEVAKSETAETAKIRWKIGMSQCNLGEPWRVQMNLDIKNAAEEHPEITVIFKDAQNDSLTQRSQIEEFINAGVDLIIVSPK
jgi:ribose transport system substrate-binding protein